MFNVFKTIMTGINPFNWWFARVDWWYEYFTDNNNYTQGGIYTSDKYSDKIMKIRQKNLNQNQWKMSLKK